MQPENKKKRIRNLGTVSRKEIIVSTKAPTKKKNKQEELIEKLLKKGVEMKKIL